MRGTLPNGGPGNMLAARLHQPLEATFEHYLADRALPAARTYAADQEKDGTPFYLALHFYGPHLPYVVPDEYFDMYDPEQIELPASVQETFLGNGRCRRTTPRTGPSTP